MKDGSWIIDGFNPTRVLKLLITVCKLYFPCKLLMFNFSCHLQIYGLKTLIKSFLPHRATRVRQKINEVLDILSKMLQKGGAFDGVISWYEI